MSFVELRAKFSAAWGLVLALGCLSAAGDEVPALLLIDGSRASPTIVQEVSGPRLVPAVDDIAEVATERVSELITERFPNGAVKLQRHVALDAGGNYLNHGNFVQYDQRGNLVVQGRYIGGKQTGLWVRTLAPSEAKSLAEQLGKPAAAALLSEATFDDGQLHGSWIVKLPGGRKLMDLRFEQGELHGTSTWWHANGQKRREASYARGKLDGQFLEWGSDGKLVTDRRYSEGRVLQRQVQWYSRGHQLCEGMLLVGADVMDARFDWWNSVAQLKVVGKESPDQRHGKWSYWHRNGQKMSEGAYRENEPVGRFTWWYDNGQKQAEGEYLDGLAAGVWVTWHSNGIKASQGEYIASVPTMHWQSWNADGTLAESQDYAREVDSSRAVAVSSDGDTDEGAKGEIESRLPLRVGPSPARRTLR